MSYNKLKSLVANVEAIETAMKIQVQGRQATAEEKEILSRYSGFGGIARGMAENPDHFFQHRESCNNYYEAVPAIVEEYMNEISKITGRKYGLFDYYGAEDAERVIIAMGSVTEAAREARVPAEFHSPCEE